MSSKKKGIAYEIDLKNGFFYDYNDLGEGEDRANAKERCELRLLNGVYYLNIQGVKDYWWLSKFKLEERGFSKMETVFSLEGENQERFAELAKQHEFKEIKIEGKISKTYYLAKPTPAEFNQILRHDAFSSGFWVKVEPGEKCYSLSQIILLGLGLLLLLLLLGKIWLKSKK